LAVQFLTRLPVSRLIPALSAEEVRAGLLRAVAWFPLVGGLVGASAALVLVAAEAFWSRAIAVVLALMVEARLTGAFHEDAVADFCDGFGGGNSRERVHEIMKDSRIGTYGALGLLFAIAARALLTLALPGEILVPAVIAAAAYGRWTAVLMMALVEPLAQSQGVARDVGQRVNARALAWATLGLLPWLLPWALGHPWHLLAALTITAAFVLWLRRLVLHKLGGVTGDCLGFAVYGAQLVLLLAAAAQWSPS
jgi:adenosylcobinamide-GDP ribazoletransferase